MVRPIVLTLVLITALTYLWGLGTPENLFKDSAEYIHLSKNLSSSGIHYAGDLNSQIDYRLFNKRTPGYAVFLGLNSNTNFVLVRLLQGLMLLLNFFIGLSLLRSLKASSRSLFLYSFLFALSLPFLLGVAFLMSDLLLCMEISLFAYLIIRYIQTRQSVFLGHSAWVFSLALITKPVLFPLGLIVAMLYLGMYIKGVGRISVLSPLLTLLAVFALNTCYFGFPHYSSISAINASQYNAGLISCDTITPAVNSVPNTREEYRYYFRTQTALASGKIMENLSEYARIHTMGMVKMLLDPGRFEIYTALGKNDPELALTPLIYAGKWEKVNALMRLHPVALGLFLFFFLLGLIKLIGLAGSVLLIRRAEVLFLQVLLAYFLIITGPVGAFRFMLAVYLPALLLTVIGFGALANLFKKGSER